MEKSTLIFDLGGVLVNYDLEADTRALAEVGLPEYFEWPKFPGLGDVCNPYLNGLMPEAEFCRRLRPFCHPDVTDEAMIHSMIAVMADLPVSRLDALRRLRDRYRLVLLSNINERTWRYCEQLFVQAGYRVDDLFHHVFLSYHLGLAKPDAAIYRHVLDTIGIEAHEALFLDDTRSNIEAAQQLGIDSWLVSMNQPEELLERLSE